MKKFNLSRNEGVPLPTVQKIYKDFQSVTGNQNRMDKKEFRRLYKEMYLSSQTGTNVAPFLTDHDLEKMSDHVFQTYDIDGSGPTFLLFRSSTSLLPFLLGKLAFEGK